MFNRLSVAWVRWSQKPLIDRVCDIGLGLIDMGVLVVFYTAAAVVAMVLPSIMVMAFFTSLVVVQKFSSSSFNAKPWETLAPWVGLAYIFSSLWLWVRIWIDGIKFVEWLNKPEGEDVY
jgi:hypothetical protein